MALPRNATLLIDEALIEPSVLIELIADTAKLVL